MNLKVRVKNPVFWLQLFLTVAATMLACSGIGVADLTTWETLGSMIVNTFKNPYSVFLIIVSIWNILNDPTTAGLGDSDLAKTYLTPKKG